MLYGISLSGTGGQIERARLENNSNNLANLDTPGFKQDLLSIMERPTESENIFWPEEAGREGRLFYDHELMDKIGGGVWLHKTHTAHTAGPLRQTENNLDFALERGGFFTVQERNSGQVFYTRAGNFTVNDQGMLVTRDGNYFVLNQQGQRINHKELLESNGGVDIAVGVEGNIEVSLASGGSIETGQALGVAIFSDEDAQRLEKYGNNMFVSLSPEVTERARQLGQLPPNERRETTAVRQGFLEGSGSNPINLMREMIEINRAFERNMSMIKLQSGTVESLIQRVARV